MNSRKPPTYGAISPPPQVVFSDDRAIEFDNISESVASKLYTINSNIKVLDNALKVIGTKKDNHGLRNQLHETQASTNQKISVSAKDIQRLKQLVDKRDKQKRLQVEKLEENFKDAVKRYSSLQQEVAKKQKSHLLVHPESFEGELAEENDVENQLQESKLRELAFEQDMIVERENALRKIEADIIDINQIFRDLGSMVNAQGEAVESIENNIDHTAGNVEEATSELMKGLSYQNKRRRKLVILIGIAVVCAVVLIVILVVELKKK